MAQSIFRTVFVFSVGSVAAALVACSGDPAVDSFTDSGVDSSTIGSGGSTSGPTTPNAGGSVGTATGGAGTGGTGTQIVCTPGCSDTPRATESCADAKAWGFCETDWFGDSCQKTCGTCDGSEEEVCVEVPVGSGGSTGSGGSLGSTDVTPVPAGSPQGWASRYWDCCKQHCSWPENSSSSGTAISCSSSDAPLSDASAQSSCSGGGSYTCWSMAPWAVSDNLAYGYAAVPPGGACGKCYQLDFNGKGHHEADDAGSRSLAGKTMIVQATNIGHDVGGGQFDILIPGGGVGAFNACSSQWGVSDLGAQYGGFLTACDGSVSCLRNKCNSVFSGKPELLAGCLFHADWMGGANNPQFSYAPVACPAALEQASGMHD